MKLKLLTAFAFICIISFSCKKEILQQEKAAAPDAAATLSKTDAAVTATTLITNYTTYTIAKGQHYCDKRPLKFVTVTEMKFYAKFDQSAVYQTSIPANQADINKLWGFSEGLDNQYNSARIGWGYSNGAVRLYGYVHNKGVRYSKEITTVVIGEDVSCSIKISGSNYVFTAKGISVTLPRGTTATKASGLQQYPYFGGDEVAPQTIKIYIAPA